MANAMSNGFNGKTTRTYSLNNMLTLDCLESEAELTLKGEAGMGKLAIAANRYVDSWASSAGVTARNQSNNVVKTIVRELKEAGVIKAVKPVKGGAPVNLTGLKKKSQLDRAKLVG